MPSYTINTEDSYENADFKWDLIKHFYTPDTSKFNPSDKEYFDSAISLLIGKEIRTSNIQPNWMPYFMLSAERIFRLAWYPMLVPREYINKEIAEYQNKLGLPMSIKAIGVLEGPMSHKKQSVKQNLTQEATGGV